MNEVISDILDTLFCFVPYYTIQTPDSPNDSSRVTICKIQATQSRMDDELKYTILEMV